MLNDSGIYSRVPYIFDRCEEFSSKTKTLYEEVRKKNLSYAPRMGTLTYGDKRKFVPLQVADNLAYETMKHLLNLKYDKTRPEGTAMKRMKRRIASIRLFTKEGLENMIASHPEPATSNDGSRVTPN